MEITELLLALLTGVFGGYALSYFFPRIIQKEIHTIEQVPFLINKVAQQAATQLNTKTTEMVNDVKKEVATIESEVKNDLSKLV